MIINNTGGHFLFEGKRFIIGGDVFANGESHYPGYLGTVKEIRDGKDKETKNDMADIYCDFRISAGCTVELIENFPELPAEAKNPEYAPLDSVIMAPHMLEPVAAELSEESGKLCVLCSFYDSDNSGAECEVLGISTDKTLLMRLMLDDVEKRKPLTFTTSFVEDECARFMYENTNLLDDDELYICYMIMPVSVYPAVEGGAA